MKTLRRRYSAYMIENIRRSLVLHDIFFRFQHSVNHTLGGVGQANSRLSGHRIRMRRPLSITLGGFSLFLVDTVTVPCGTEVSPLRKSVLDSVFSFVISMWWFYLHIGGVNWRGILCNNKDVFNGQRNPRHFLFEALRDTPRPSFRTGSRLQGGGNRFAKNGARQGDNFSCFFFFGPKRSS